MCAINWLHNDTSLIEFAALSVLITMNFHRSNCGQNLQEGLWNLERLHRTQRSRSIGLFVYMAFKKLQKPLSVPLCAAFSAESVHHHFRVTCRHDSTTVTSGAKVLTALIVFPCFVLPLLLDLSLISSLSSQPSFSEYLPPCRFYIEKHSWCSARLQWTWCLFSVP